MRGSAPKWRRSRRKRWRRREKWKRGWSVNATSAVTKAEGADVVVVVGGGMEGVLHQGEEDLRHDVETLLQGEVDLLLNDLGCSLLQGLLAAQVEEAVADGEST